MLTKEEHEAIVAEFSAEFTGAASGVVAVPLAALQEVIRISDRQHPDWDVVKAAMAAGGAAASFFRQIPDEYPMLGEIVIVAMGSKVTLQQCLFVADEDDSGLFFDAQDSVNQFLPMTGGMWWCRWSDLQELVRKQAGVKL